MFSKLGITTVRPTRQQPESLTMWNCAKCGESIEDQFDACWKCGTSFQGVVDPNFSKSPTLSQDSSVQEAAAQLGRSPRTTCPDCRSQMRTIKLIDRAGEFDSLLTYARADAERSWLFARYPEEGKVAAKMCPSCGRIILHAEPNE